MYGGLGTFPLGLGGLYSEHGDKLTLRELEDKLTAFIKDANPGVLALLYQTLNRSGYTLDACRSKIAALKTELKP